MDIFGIEPGFTQNVSKLVDDIMTNSAGIIRSSLDFEHQRTLMEKSGFKEGYQESKTLEKLKMEFVEQNELPDQEEIQNKLHDQHKEEYLKLQREAAEKLPYFKMIRKLSMNPTLGDEVAENTLEAIAQFNYDMKMLALNAYQM